jgi:hypothetical protein
MEKILPDGLVHMPDPSDMSLEQYQVHALYRPGSPAISIEDKS